jgi:hypothetical protein
VRYKFQYLYTKTPSLQKSFPVAGMKLKFNGAAQAFPAKPHIAENKTALLKKWKYFILYFSKLIKMSPAFCL